MNDPHEIALASGDRVRLQYGVVAPATLEMQTVDTTGALTISRWRPDEARRLAAALRVWADGVSPQESQ